MAKKKRERRESGIDISEKQYQKAIRRARDQDVIQKLQDIYSSSEKRKTSKLAESLAKKVSKGFIGYGASSYKTPIRERRFSAVARKAISLVAPRSSMVRTVTQTSKKNSGKGRGRPAGTFRLRVLPSGKTVKVPTHIYKKMLSAEKAQIRLAQAQQMGMAQQKAEQLAMQQDMRYQQPISEEQFLAEPDQQHEMEVMRAQQQAELMGQMEARVPQTPSVGQRIIGGLSDFGRGLSRLGQARPQAVDQFGRPIDQFGRPIQQQAFRPQQMGPQPSGMGIKGEPRVTAVSERASLLNVPNTFNNPGESSILWNKKRRLY